MPSPARPSRIHHLPDSQARRSLAAGRVDRSCDAGWGAAEPMKSVAKASHKVGSSTWERITNRFLARLNNEMHHEISTKNMDIVARLAVPPSLVCRGCRDRTTASCERVAIMATLDANCRSGGSRLINSRHFWCCAFRTERLILAYRERPSTGRP